MSLHNLLLILWCLLTLEICSTVALSQLTVRPDTFNVASGPALNITCTFDYQYMYDLVSLTSIILSKRDDLSPANTHFTNLAWVAYFAPNVINVLTPVNASTNGLIRGKDGRSFLSLYWEYPSLNEEGLYQCTIIGLDGKGKSVEIFNQAKVTADRSTLRHLTEFVRQQQIEISNLKTSADTLNTRQSIVKNRLSQANVSLENMANKQKVFENSITNITNVITGMHNQLSQLQTTRPNLISTFFTARRPEYNGKYYLISKNVCNNADDSQNICELVGGYLVEIDDLQEQNFVDYQCLVYGDFSNDNAFVIFGGTDEAEDGHWIWRTSHRDISYNGFGLFAGRYDTSRNCMGQYKYASSWSTMNCKSPAHFLCEVPKL